MPYIHIIALYEIFVILVTLYFIIKLHFKNNRISKEDDLLIYMKKKKKVNKKMRELISNEKLSISFNLSPIALGTL